MAGFADELLTHAAKTLAPQEGDTMLLSMYRHLVPAGGTSMGKRQHDINIDSMRNQGVLTHFQADRLKKLLART